MAPTTDLASQLTEEQRHSLADLREAELDAQQRVRRLFELLPDPLLTFDEIASLLDAKTKTKKAVEEALAALVQEGFLEEGSGTAKPFSAAEPIFRKRDVPLGKLRVLALESELRARRDDETAGEVARYQFSIEGRFIRTIAKVDRLFVTDVGQASGLQRDEIKNHVTAIKEGVESGTEIDNAILLAVPSDSVVFDPQDTDEVSDSTIVIRGKSNVSQKSIAGLNGEPVELQKVRLVEIEFPFRSAMFDSEKSAILVDGQQRTAGILLSSVEKRPRINVPVNMIIGDDNRAKSSFLVSNSTVSIKKDLLNALIADLDSEFVPGNLKKDELPARVVKALALEEGPLHGLVSYAGHQSSQKPVIVFQTARAVVDAFLACPALKGAEETGDVATIKRVIDCAFEEVKRVWPKAWGLSPKDSRLMHGGGLRVVASHLADIFKTSPKVPADLSAFRQNVASALSKVRTRIVWAQDEFPEATQEAKQFYNKHLSTLENTGKSIKELKRNYDFEVYEVTKD